jgi:hypothetical protein
MNGDVGRQIIFQASRAIITVFDSPTLVHADIIDDFPNLTPMPPHQWFLRLSPQATLDPDKKGPVGIKVTLIANKDSFRAGDNGKYIKIYSGVVHITSIVSVTTVIGEILSLLDSTNDDPPAAPAGSWTLEVSSWSDVNGYPRTGEFYQGRLLQASTTAQPTTFWLSASDDFDNYATGIHADDAIEYTLASRTVNRIEWGYDLGSLLMGTSGAEFSVEGQNQGDPLGGDVVPNVKRFTSEGSAGFQPVTAGNKLIFFDRSQKKVFIIDFSLESNGFISEEITALAEHITGDSGIRLRGVAFARRPDPRIYMVRRDGQMAVLTYFAQEKVVGFTRFRTEGKYEAVAVIPRGPGLSDRVWTIVQRNIGATSPDDEGSIVRYVEYFDDSLVLTDRPWRGLNTDAASVYNGLETTTITGFPYLNGQIVDVVANGSFRGTRVVSAGGFTLEDPASTVEFGIHYDSKFVSMRPAIQGSVIEGLARSWDKLWVRVVGTVGGMLNGREIRYPPAPLGNPNVFTGDRDVTQNGWDTLGRVTVEQTQPYPMTLLALFGTLTVGDHD